MKLTVKEFNEALTVAKKRSAQIFIVESKGELEIVINSASPSEMRIGNIVIKAMDIGEIENESLIYENCRYTLEEFCNLLNEEYAN